MEKEEYIQKAKELWEQITSLYEELNEMTEHYYTNQNIYLDGTVVDVIYDDGSKVRAITDGDYYINDDTGNLLPTLYNLGPEGEKSLPIYYENNKNVVEIRKIGKGSTCFDCGSRTFDGSNFICTKFSQKEITPDKLMCSYGEFVKWKNGVPYKSDFMLELENESEIQNHKQAGYIA